jgi:dynactin complex subunit
LRAQAKAKRDESEQQKQQDAQEIETLKAERDGLLMKINTELSSEIQALRSEVERLQSENAAFQQTVEKERQARQSEPTPKEASVSNFLKYFCNFQII